MTENQQVAIVTGAAGGIGRAMTRALLTAGIQVAGVDRDREPLEALAASARQQGKAAELLTIAADLTDDSAVDAITKATRVKFGRIDILVNNAGIGPRSNPAGQLAASPQILGDHVRSVAPLRRGAHDGTTGLPPVVFRTPRSVSGSSAASRRSANGSWPRSMMRVVRRRVRRSLDGGDFWDN